MTTPYQAEASNPYAALQSVRSLTPLQDVLAYTKREYNDLCELIDSEIFQYMPKDEQGRLQRQKLIMIDYVAVLNERIVAWGSV